jgi:hypothetical protein
VWDTAKEEVYRSKSVILKEQEQKIRYNLVLFLLISWREMFSRAFHFAEVCAKRWGLI